MKRWLQTLKLTLVTSLFGLVLFAAPVAASALSVNTVASIDSSKYDVCSGAGLSAKECNGGGAGALNNIVAGVLNVLSVIVGVAAVIMVILSGFKYTTSGGDAQKIAAAKTTLIYALVGAVIVSLARVIVHFVLAKA